MITLLEGQSRQIKREYLLHHRYCDNLNQAKRRLGISIIILSGIATLTIALIPTYVSPPPEWVRVSPIFFSGIRSVLASVMTFERPGARAVQHQNAASNYYRILDQCQAYAAQAKVKARSIEILTEYENTIRGQIYGLQKDSPPIPNSVYNKREEIIDAYDKTDQKMNKI